MFKIEDISEIRKKENGKGYEIVFNDGSIIWLIKRRTIISLLMLIRYGVSSEADLARGSQRLGEVKEILKGKFNENWILDSYADANKPFSELWNEEGFTWIHPAENKLSGNQQYELLLDDHSKLLQDVRKAFREAPSPQEQVTIFSRQNGNCNFCGSSLKPKSGIFKSTFAKDRVRVVYDHRIPVEKGGESNTDNYQALCFYCNKSKWQICNICELDECDPACALVNPESSTVVAPTKEDISDRFYR